MHVLWFKFSSRGLKFSKLVSLLFPVISDYDIEYKVIQTKIE